MSPRLGIYGAGQLGAFLCRAAKNLDIETTVIAPRVGDTATHYADQVIVAPLEDMYATSALLASCDVVTFDLENVPSPVLREIRRQSVAGQVRVAPSTADLILLQNKLSQKRWLSRRGFPTALFIDCPAGIEVADIAMQVGLPFVQKYHRGGYDGRGVQIVRDITENTTFWPGPSIAEQYVHDKREIAVLVARSRSGELAIYPVMEMEFDPVGNLVRRVVAPAPIDSTLAEQATTLASDVVTALNGVGLFTVEMFVTPAGQVLINEIAPRVHNAGHLTLEANVASQYEQHVRAVFDLPLASTEQIKPACMVNILNEPVFSGVVQSSDPSTTNLSGDTVLHWYGKAPTTPLRKMGHLTSVADTLDLARQRADTALDALVTRTADVA